MKKVFKVLMILIFIVLIAIVAIAAYIKTALPHLEAASNVKVEITPQRIARGQYLANHITACMDCHSERDWNKYAGPIVQTTFGAGGEKFGKEIGFPGTLYSRNITPYAMHDWTDGEIIRAITEGENKNNKALFPLMGYPSFAKMTKEDVYSIVAYLRSIPSLQSDIPARSLDFPLNFIVNTMPAKAELLTTVDSNNTLAYGKYLITIANCSECHSKVKNGVVIKGTEYGGGRQFLFANGTSTTSANITFDKRTGIGNWSKEIFIKKFKQYGDSNYHAQTIAANGNNTTMPWTIYAGMSEKDLAAIYTYLQTIKPIDNKVDIFGGAGAH